MREKISFVEYIFKSAGLGGLIFQGLVLLAAYIVGCAVLDIGGYWDILIGVAILNIIWVIIYFWMWRRFLKGKQK